MSEQYEVIHNAAAKRFEIMLGDDLAMVEYMQAGSNTIFTHTEVPVAYEGRGLANILAKAALDWAIAQGYRIQAVCPFVALYVRKHKEYQPHTWGYE